MQFGFQIAQLGLMRCRVFHSERGQFVTLSTIDAPPGMKV